MSRGRAARSVRIAVRVAALTIAVALGVEGARIARDLGTSDLSATDYVGSGACRDCHRDRYRTWHRTYHRTMTREASDETVLGAFDGREVVYGGVHARMDRARDGAFRITFSAPGRASRAVRVGRTVGSHRYQQYLAREGDRWVRLPIAWHVEERRFFHMNEAFLTPDPDEPAEGSAISEVDYDRHVVRWNDNCVFCHNVAPRPGLTRANGVERFDTTVAELGVACEACHGPGGLHAEARADPLRSLALSAAPDDPTIVSPKDLDPERRAEVCGRCHGQRLAADIEPFLRDGDPFVPGEDLSRYSTPLARDTPLAGDPNAFALRFWADGTPRLTAYEYQGLLSSRCYSHGSLTCTTCHGMHEGNPAGQIRPEALGDGACVDCHERYGSTAGLAAHTHHDPSGAGSRCTGCHMPRIVYGLIGARISHRIEVPDPARDARFGRPDACTLCHVDDTRAWAIAARAQLWGEPSRSPAPAPEEAPATELPATVVALLGGDPIERAIAADALGRTSPPARPERRPVRLYALLDALASDSYPAVRRIARRSVLALVPADLRPAVERYEVSAGARERVAASTELTLALPRGAVSPIDPDVRLALSEHADQVAIEIGE